MEMSSSSQPSTSRGTHQGQSQDQRQRRPSPPIETGGKSKIPESASKSVASSSKSTSISSSSSKSTSTSTSSSKSTSTSSSNATCAKEIWLRVERHVMNYLRESRLIDVNDFKTRSPAEKRLYSVLISISQKVEMGILFRLLDMHSQTKRSSIMLKSDEQVLLLKLVVWALHEWKTFSRPPTSSKERKDYVEYFEKCFFETLQKIRVESAVSTKVKSSTKALEMLRMLRKIQKLWVALDVDGNEKLRRDDVVDALEEIVSQDVAEKKMFLNEDGMEEMKYRNQYDEVRGQLEVECNRRDTSSKSKATQGVLIKKLVEVFKESVIMDNGHRDHIFIQNLLFRTTTSPNDYKRALVWVLLGILPYLKEGRSATRLIHYTQGLIRQAMSASATKEFNEVAMWKRILESTLQPDALDFFHNVVLTKKYMARFRYTDKTFEDIYPPPIEVDVVEFKQEIVDVEEEKKNEEEKRMPDLRRFSVVISFLRDEAESIDPWEINETNNWGIMDVSDVSDMNDGD